MTAAGPVVAVTGATGWVGRAACEYLSREGGAGRVVAFASRARSVRLSTGSVLAVRSLDDLPSTPHDVLLHFAYVTREHASERGLDEYVEANAAITATVRRAIAAQRPEAVLHASSGAAAAAGDDLATDPYGVLKRRDEDALRDAVGAAGGRIVTMRIFNLAGPWMAKRGFAIGSIVDQIQAGGPVILRATRPVLRSYTDVEDAVRVGLAACLAAGLPSDVALETGGEPVELGELARRAAVVLGRPETAIERTWDPNLAADRYLGDPHAFQDMATRLGHSLHDLDSQIRRTAPLPSAN